MSANTWGAEEEQPPSLELLEFLGEWESDNGEWVNPVVVFADEAYETLTGMLLGNDDEEGDE